MVKRTLPGFKPSETLTEVTREKFSEKLGENVSFFLKYILKNKVENLADLISLHSLLKQIAAMALYGC